MVKPLNTDIISNHLLYSSTTSWGCVALIDRCMLHFCHIFSYSKLWIHIPSNAEIFKHGASHFEIWSLIFWNFKITEERKLLLIVRKVEIYYVYRSGIPKQYMGTNQLGTSLPRPLYRQVQPKINTGPAYSSYCSKAPILWVGLLCFSFLHLLVVIYRFVFYSAIKTGRYTLEKHAENIDEVKRLQMQEEMRKRGAQMNASLNAKLQGNYINSLAMGRFEWNFN